MSTVGSSAWREEVWGRGCNMSVIVSTHWILGAGKIQCHKNSARVWRAVGRIMRRYGYAVRSNATGCYNCRKVTGGSSLSSHAQGVGLDVNWDTNPYRKDRLVTDMPAAMIRDIQLLKNDAGTRAVRWGGDWDGRPETPHGNYDSMHLEVICTPADVKAGFSIPPFSITDQLQWPLLTLHEKGGAVTQLQMLLSREQEDLDPDGYFGPITERAVQRFQLMRGLPGDGVVGLGTWTALLTNQPRLIAGDVTPHKDQV